MRCRLCGKEYQKLSAEHYPAKSVGNNDLVKIDLQKLLTAGESVYGKTPEEMDAYFDNEVVVEEYRNGRTANTLCGDCNSFLGKYDEDYKKFYLADGAYSVVKGYQKRTKINIIKSIYGKFLSIPETENEVFDFLDFLNDRSNEVYRGKWHLYFMRRNPQERLLGLLDYSTHKGTYNEGVVYEMCDEKFIFDLMSFEIKDKSKMNNIFEILGNYQLALYDGGFNSYHSNFICFGQN